MRTLLALALCLSSGQAVAESAWEAFHAGRCENIEPFVDQDFGDGSYSAHNGQSMAGDGDTLIPAGAPFLLKTKKTKFEAAGRTQEVVVERIGKKAVKLLNGFSQTVYVFEETTKCQKLYDRLLDSLKEKK